MVVPRLQCITSTSPCSAYPYSSLSLSHLTDCSSSAQAYSSTKDMILQFRESAAICPNSWHLNHLQGLETVVLELGTIGAGVLALLHRWLERACFLERQWLWCGTTLAGCTISKPWKLWTTSYQSLLLNLWQQSNQIIQHLARLELHNLLNVKLWSTKICAVVCSWSSLMPHVMSCSNFIMYSSTVMSRWPKIV